MALYDDARAAFNAGFNVVPVKADGSKRPDLDEWVSLKTRRVTEAELAAWFANGRQGMGVICGAISGGLEMLEFEGRAVDEGLHATFTEAAEALGLADLLDRIVGGYLEETPSGGLHLLYRCDPPDHVDGNLKLARRPRDSGGVDVLIETRGEGGYVVTAPSSGSVHATGRPWRLVQGGWHHIATVTADERAVLLQLARSFDQMPKVEPARHADDVGARPANSGPSRLRPGDDYTNRTTWTDVLTPHGWQLRHERGGTGYWRKPASHDIGHHATTNHDRTDLLYVFSTATIFEPERGYNRFSAYALLNHGGDIETAARALAAQGYGDRRDPLLTRIEQRKRHDNQPDDNDNTALERRPFTRIPLDLTTPITPPQLIANWLYTGRLTVLQSEPGVGKSWLAAWLALAVIDAGMHAIYMDEEGGPDIVKERFMALGANPETVAQQLHYFAFEHRVWHPGDLDALDDMLATIEGDIGLVVLDSLPDFLAAAGLDEDRAPDVTAFVARVCARFRQIGIAQLVLDHLPKPPNEGKTKRSRYSRGSGAKLAKADATLLLETVAEFDAATSGRLRLWKTKDRRGRLPLPGLTRDPILLDVTVDPGAQRLAIQPTTVAAVRAQPWDGPTECMNAVLDVLRANPGREHTKRQLRTAVRAAGRQFRDDTIDEAAARLAVDGRIDFRAGPRRAELYRCTPDTTQPELTESHAEEAF